MMVNESVDVEVVPLPQYAELFPLQLAPFEEFMLQMERPGYPTTFYMELIFLGRMNRQALLQAVEEAAARHPLLIAHVEAHHEGLKWVLATKAHIPVDFQDPHSPYHPPRGTNINLQKGCGLRVWIREDAERTSMTLQIHHACCDGEGSRHFVFDFCAHYARRTGQMINDTSTRVEYQRLHERAVFHPTVSNPDSPPPRTTVWQKIRNAYHFHVLGPSPLAPTSDRSDLAASPTELPLMLTHVFSREETLQIEERATQSETAVNDVAIGLLFQTLANWNRQNSRATAKQRLRILMPTDLRERADRRLTATNRIGFAFLGRTIGQCTDLSALLDGISEETKYIRTYKLGLDFIQIMAAVQKIRIIVFALQRWRPCMATAVLTNLGDTTRRFRSRFPVNDGYPVIGDVRLEKISGVPPLAPGTHSGFGICFCAGHMSVSIRSDYSRLGREGTATILNAYVAAWKNWALGLDSKLKLAPNSSS